MVTAKTEKISVELSPGLAATVREAVDSGKYANASEVVCDALHEWEINRQIATTGDYIARDDSARAREFVEALPAHCGRTAEAAAAYPRREDSGAAVSASPFTANT